MREDTGAAGRLLYRPACGYCLCGVRGKDGFESLRPSAGRKPEKIFSDKSARPGEGKWAADGKCIDGGQERRSKGGSSCPDIKDGGVRRRG